MNVDELDNNIDLNIANHIKDAFALSDKELLP